jgi:hypothetical protein
LFVFWYHSPNILDTPHICNISRLRVNVLNACWLDGLNDANMNTVSEIDFVNFLKSMFNRKTGVFTVCTDWTAEWK